jgi:hypothetical protein
MLLHIVDSGKVFATLGAGSFFLSGVYFGMASSMARGGEHFVAASLGCQATGMSFLDGLFWICIGGLRRRLAGQQFWE